MFLRQISDDTLAQHAYLIGCQESGEAILFDPQRDIDRYLSIARREGLRVAAVAETHIHADFLSGAREFAERFGARLYLSGEGGPHWRYEWASNGEHDYVPLSDGTRFEAGRVEFQAIHTPGHTPEHMSFLVSDRGSGTAGGTAAPICLLSGDFVFAGDLGRPDLLETAVQVKGAMEPAARRLYGSLRSFLELPDYLQVWPAHGAGSSCGKALGAVPSTTVGYERRASPAIMAARAGEDDFVSHILSSQPDPPLYFSRMKRLNHLGVPLLGSLPSPRKLGSEQLAELAARGLAAVGRAAVRGAAGEGAAHPTAPSAARLEGQGAAPDRADAVLIDTRPDRTAFMERHIPGSIYIPLTKSFCTAAGSVIVDRTAPITLILDEDLLDAAVRCLVRIGFDNIRGFAGYDTLEQHFAEGGDAASIPAIDFAEAARLASADGEAGAHVVDVRYGSEYAAGHVPGAINSSYTRMPEHADALPGGDDLLLVHCQTGARAAVAASYLAREGRRVRYIDDLFVRWRQSWPRTGSRR